MDLLEAMERMVKEGPPLREGPTYVLVPPRIYEAMQQMPGGPSWENYLRVRQEPRGES